METPDRNKITVAYETMPSQNRITRLHDHAAAAAVVRHPLAPKRKSIAQLIDGGDSARVIRRKLVPSLLIPPIGDGADGRNWSASNNECDSHVAVVSATAAAAALAVVKPSCQLDENRIKRTADFRAAGMPLLQAPFPVASSSNHDTLPHGTTLQAETGWPLRSGAVTSPFERLKPRTRIESDAAAVPSASLIKNGTMRSEHHHEVLFRSMAMHLMVDDVIDRPPTHSCDGTRPGPLDLVRIDLDTDGGLAFPHI